MYFDPVWIMFAIPGLLLGLYAQFKLSATYNKYIRVGISSGLSGAQAAREILDRAGLTDVPVAEVPGKLTDHYDPSKRALFLSSDNFRERSIAAVGVAAHEAGHALQHQAAYAPLKLRMAMVPVTKFASTAYSLILLLSFGLMYGGKISGGMFSHMITFVIVLFSIITFFQLVTLPVEFDASKRAKEQLMRLGIVRPQEGEAVNKVLSAAAMTYVAAMISAVMELLYWLSVARNRN